MELCNDQREVIEGGGGIRGRFGPGEENERSSLTDHEPSGYSLTTYIYSRVSTYMVINSIPMIRHTCTPGNREHVAEQHLEAGRDHREPYHFRKGY